MRVTQMLQQLLRDIRGATAVEYGLIVALIVIAIITAVNNVADANTGMWAVVTRAVTSAMAGA